MSTQEINLRDLLEQDRQLVLEILELSRKLILEVEATHYWLKQSLDHFRVLGGIATNLSSLFDTLEPHWGTPATINHLPEGLKLWKTAVGLGRALQPVRGQLLEQISRRRRQRIMGEELIELEDLDPETIKVELATFNSSLAGLNEQFNSFQGRIAQIPLGVQPPQPAAPTEGAPVPAPPAPVTGAPGAPTPEAQPIPETEDNRSGQELLGH